MFVKTSLTLISVLLVKANASLPAASYCTPDGDCWPTDAEWNALSDEVGGRLFPISPSVEVPECLDTGLDGTLAAGIAHGACMPNRGCWYEKCDIDKSWNLPSYSVEVTSVADIQAVLSFANTHDIAVSVKATGHGYAGSAMMYGTIMIWMYGMNPEVLEINAFTDSCGTVTADTIKVGGGTPWGDVFNTIKTTHDIVSGGSVNVGAAGGWLAGGGMAAMSRLRGLGIDNLLAYEVVLANGEFVTVDACTNSDLFWALRGGGGGSWGVVTSAWYRLWPKTSIVDLTVYHNGIRTVDSLTQWINFLVDEIEPTTLDRRWGGYWGASCHSHATGKCLNFKFWGSMEDAQTTLIDKLETWATADSVFSIETSEAASFIEGQYGDGAACGAFMGCGAATACERWGVMSSSEGNDVFYTRPSSWMLDKDFWEDKEFAKSTLVDAISIESADGRYCVQGDENPDKPASCNYDFGGLYTGYILGGAVNDVEGNATGINPYYRNSGANILSLEEAAIDGGMALIRSRVSASTPCFNHDGHPHVLSSQHWSGNLDAADATPEQWQSVYWGSHVSRLEEIKLIYDPDRRFNCYQCIGYTRINPDGVSQDVIDGYDDLTWEADCPVATGWLLIYTLVPIVAVLIIGVVVGVVLQRAKSKTKATEDGKKNVSEKVEPDVEMENRDTQKGPNSLKKTEE